MLFIPTIFLFNNWLVSKSDQRLSEIVNEGMICLRNHFGSWSTMNFNVNRVIDVFRYVHRCIGYGVMELAGVV